MNSRAGHLEEGELLRLIDGELPGEEADAARRHIESCWNCRTHFQEFETVIGEYVRYQKNIDLVLPPPPRAWPELQFSGPPEIEPPAIRMLPTRRWFDWRWAVAAAGVALAVVVWYRLQTPPTVNAAGLLRQAIATESMASESMGGSIRIKVKDGTVVRPAVLRNRTNRNTSNDRDEHLREMFERAHFDWERPLSARAFAQWRDQLKDKRDEVRFETGGSSGNAYLIRTSTTSSELHRATLVLRARDMQPVHEMLEFTGETVEIERAVGPTQQAAPAGSSATQQVPAAPSPELSLHRLLQVFATLHRLDADLGEPIEIRQAAGHIDVAAIGLTASRQQQLRAALETIPFVSVSVDSDASRPTSRSAGAKSPPTGASPGQAALEDILGSAQAAEDFTDRALDSSDRVLARVHALRALAKAFPPPQEAAMTDRDRQLLATLRQDHTTALLQRIAELRNVLQPVVSINSHDINSYNPATPERTGSWQAKAENVFLASQHFDETLNRELAGNAVNPSDFSPIAAAFEQLDRVAGAAVMR